MGVQPCPRKGKKSNKTYIFFGFFGQHGEHLLCTKGDVLTSDTLWMFVP